jgi:hypothetical protein
MKRGKIALECVECRKKLSSENAAGWQAFLVGDPDIEDDEEIAVYCPDCAAGIRPVSPWV